MATKKASKKSTKKTTTKAAKKAAKKPAKKAGGANGKGKLRVRMYRVGFGDFFLITVPTKAGPQHILIDCGVHAGNIGTMKDCVQDLINVTNRKLALVIATHYHADHLSGFASNFDEFAKFEVGMVWITNRLDPDMNTPRSSRPNCDRSLAICSLGWDCARRARTKTRKKDWLHKERCSRSVMHLDLMSTTCNSEPRREKAQTIRPSDS
jgi:beta-lactamase superfamily II metal-dependent hydrolase